MASAQVVKWGNSLAVRIPKSIAARARMKEGDALEIKAAKGRIELRSAERIPTLEELVAQITPENRHPETDWGPDVGREKIEW
ncbi:MAG: AbrB/MazE/SpoVT family DNA-binding domain-containing protein [Candidatus Sulfotelmatobacter sp.]|uniref:Transcriptional regulator/antitoxin, MazE n=1 Tax=Candidatus Sulfotelmatobacter kueseliae TaxID=2042962 RepID=A0A2U3L964_9BACT|nr:Transcriptional regulator/antitoxin, MazE [Candidatus Sulfotelmatobacter kueseliae]